MEENELMPDILPADFNEWDSAPDTLPADFNEFEKEPEMVYLKDEADKLSEEKSTPAPEQSKPLTLEEKKRKLEELKIDKEISLLSRAEQVGKDIMSAGKGMVGQLGSLGAAIPANIAEAVGMNADEIRKSQKYWQDLTQEARDELTTTYGDSELAKSMLFATANPMTYSGQSILSMIGIGGAEKAMDIASSGDRSGATISDAGDVAGSAALAGAAGKVIDYIAPSASKEVRTSFGKSIDKLPKEQSTALEEVFKTMEGLKIDNFTEQGRKELVGMIDFTKPREEVSRQVVDALASLRDKAKSNVDSLYAEANTLAKLTDKVELQPLMKDVYSKADGSTAHTKAVRNVANIMKNMPEGNAADIESVLKSLKTLQRSPSAEGGKYIYGQAIETLENKQRELGGDAIYAGAREASKRFKTQFEGKIKGEGGQTGKTISQAITDKQSYNIASDILSGKIDADKAKDLVDIGLDEASRLDMVKDIMTQGLDKDDILKKGSIDEVVNRFSKFDADGLKKMLGDNYKPFKQKMEALNVINNTIKNNENLHDGIKGELKNIVASVLVYKASPVFGTKGILLSGSSIVEKKLLKENANKLMARSKVIKDKKTRNAFAKAVSLIVSGEYSNAKEEVKK